LKLAGLTKPVKIESSQGKAATYRAHEMREHTLASTAVAQSFRIRVLQPISATDAHERFPVLYTTDADYFFGGLAALAHLQQLLGETPRFILVGIGYRDRREAEVLRMRDLLPRAAREWFLPETRSLSQSPLVEGTVAMDSVATTTDASDFLSFIRQELMPFIDATYPTVGGDNSYCGYSAGGGFGLYTLFTEPEIFKRYIIGSPTTSHSGHHFAIDWAKSFQRSGKKMDAQVFMSVGELEEFQRGQYQFDLVSGYVQLTKFLKQASIAGLHLTTRLFAGETHATAWTLAFSHGTRTVFGPADSVPFSPDYMQ
jgi:predicted alpha/beta superfamily hydrolase